MRTCVWVCVCVCVCVHARARVCACVRVCVCARAYVRAYVRARVRVCVCMLACVRVCVCVRSLHVVFSLSTGPHSDLQLTCATTKAMLTRRVNSGKMDVTKTVPVWTSGEDTTCVRTCKCLHGCRVGW